MMHSRIPRGVLCGMVPQRPHRGSFLFDTRSAWPPQPEPDSLCRGIEAVLKLLATLPATKEVLGLIEEADELRCQGERWHVDVPSAEARDRAMRHVLAMHVAVAGLVRRKPEGRDPL